MITVSLNQMNVFNRMIAESEPLTLRKLCENIENLDISALSFCSYKPDNRLQLQKLDFEYRKKLWMQSPEDAITRLGNAYEIANTRLRSAH